MDYVDILTRFIAPPILGALGALVAPWTAWGVEKRRGRLNRRRQLIDFWRSHLINQWDPTFDQMTESGLKFTQKSSYLTLRPHLTPSLRDKFSRIPDVLEIDVGLSDPLENKKILAEEINRIERAWKLI